MNTRQDQWSGKSYVRQVLISSVAAGALLLALSFNACGVPFTLKVQKLIDNGLRPQWSFDSQWIVFDRKVAEKYQVFRIRPDRRGEECLTCGIASLPGHNGGPHMHPNGRYVIFSAEKAVHPAIPVGSTITDPGAGIYNDIAVINIQTKEVLRLTNARADAALAGGNMHPRFSFDGKKVMYSDFERPTFGLGDYQIAVADFVDGTPLRLANVRYYNPGEKSEMGEAQGFSPDGNKVYFTCAALHGQSDLSADICEFEMATAKLKRITRSAGVRGELASYEEHGAVNPVYPGLIYMSSGFYGVNLLNNNFLSWLKADLWVVDLEGNNARQVTFFNTPGHPESDPNGHRVVLSKMGWNPAGNQLVISVWKVGKENDPTDDRLEIDILSVKQ